MEYRHGPIAIAQPGRAVWVFGRPVEHLSEHIAATGATLVDDDLDPVADPATWPARSSSTKVRADAVGDLPSMLG